VVCQKHKDTRKNSGLRSLSSDEGGRGADSNPSNVSWWHRETPKFRRGPQRKGAIAEATFSNRCGQKGSQGLKRHHAM